MFEGSCSQTMKTPDDNPDNMLYRLSQGDERAFDRFMGQWSQRLYHYAMSMLGTKENVEEVVSDVFLQVWKSRKELIKIKYMEQWLRKITYCRSMSKLRSDMGTPKFVSIDDLETFTMPVLEVSDESVLSHEQQEAVNQVLDSLPPRCKHVFFLAKLEKMPYKQIAAVLDISLSTVNYHVAYAMDQLRKKLKQ